MKTWIILAIAIIALVGIVFFLRKRYYHVYSLKNIYGYTVYVGWAKRKTIDEKILPKAESLGLRVYSVGSFCRIFGKGKDDPTEDYVNKMPEKNRPYTSKYDHYFDHLH